MILYSGGNSVYKDLIPSQQICDYSGDNTIGSCPEQGEDYDNDDDNEGEDDE